MKQLSKTLLAVMAAVLVSSVLVCHQAQAAMITGNINFAGGAKYDTDSLATATRVNTFKSVVVVAEDGDFASFVNDGDVVTMAIPYIFTPSTPTPGLWSVGGFTFDLSSSTVVLQNSTFLAISGTGTLSGNGFEPTPGTWTFTSQTPATKRGLFSFSAGTAAVPGVPEGGTTVALLGFALAGIEVIRRKLASA